MAGAVSWGGPKLYNWFVRKIADKKGASVDEVAVALERASENIKDPAQKAGVQAIIGDDAVKIADSLAVARDTSGKTPSTRDMDLWAEKEDLISQASNMLWREREDAIARGAGFDDAVELSDFFRLSPRPATDTRPAQVRRSTGGFRKSHTDVINHYSKIHASVRKAKNEAFDRVKKEQTKNLATRDRDLSRGWGKLEREAASAKNLESVRTMEAARKELDTFEDTLLVGKIDAEEVAVVKETAKRTDNIKEIDRQLRSKVDRVQRRAQKARFNRNQTGNIDLQLMTHLASMGGGAAIGAGLNPEDPLAGALAGIAAGYAPIGAYKFMNMLANRMPPHWSRWKRLDMAMRSENYVFKPWSYLPKLGESGELLAYKIREVMNKVDRVTSRIRSSLVVNANEMNVSLTDPAVRDHIVDVLMKKATPKTKEIAGVARSLKDQFDYILDRMQETGVITEGVAGVVRAGRAKQGFWPVVLDDSKIAVSQEDWVTYFSTQPFNQEALESTVGAISSIKDFGGLRSGVYKLWTHPSGQKVASLTEKAALDLWHRRKTNPFTILHTGQEDTTGLRSILEPWLSKDILHIMTDYLSYAHRKIGFAESFGGTITKETTKKGKKVVTTKFDKNLLAKKLFADIADEADMNAAVYAEQIYYGAQHSSKSKNIRAAGERKPWIADAEGRAMALNTMLLSLAQIYNVGQSLVYSTVKAGTYGQNPIHALRTTTSALVKTFHNKSQILADTGAAAEVALVQQLGEISTSAHTIFGRELSNRNPIEWLQNPSKFLRMIGFIKIEEFNRALSANVGEITALRLASQKIELEKAGKIGTKEYKRVLGWMKELGMDTKRKLNTVDELRADELRNAGDLAEAAINFSNEVNFRNNALQMPLKWSHPNAKLFRQFKTFALHHASFLKRNVVDEALKGNLTPLALFLGLGGAVGTTLHEGRQMVGRALETPKELASGNIDSSEIGKHILPDFEAAKEWIENDDDELTGLKKVLDWYSAVGGAGMWAQMLTSFAERGPSGLAKEVAGPTFGRAWDFTEDVHREVTSIDWEEDPSQIGQEGFNALGRPFYETYIRGGLGSVSRKALPEWERGD
jgi:hypothetical protein